MIFMKINIDDIKKAYKNTHPLEQKIVFTYYIRRPISYYLAWIFLRMSISANKITITWLLIGLIGSIFLIEGKEINMLIGLLLIEFAIILDAVDGHVARFTKSTLTGSILDLYSGELIYSLSLLAFSIGISKQNISTIYIYNYNLDNSILMYLGLFIAFTNLFSKGVIREWYLRTEHKIRLVENLHSAPYIIIYNIFGYAGAYPLILIISVILGIGDVLVILFAIINGGYAVIVLNRIFSKNI